MVLVSFAVFLATAVAVFFSSGTFSKIRRQSVLKMGTVPQQRLSPEKGLSPFSKEAPARSASRVTINARSTAKWIHFNLSQDRIVHPQYVSSENWDLAFKRYHVIANGGSTNLAAAGAILDLGGADFNHLPSIPAQGFIQNTRTPNGLDSENLAIRHWYNYDYASHILTPLSHVYLVRTPENRCFALRILDYYCRNGASGCLSFEYYRVK